MNVSPESLLKQAKKLTAPSVGRPDETKLRRAVSDAYYAVFHALTEASAKLLVSGASREDFRQYVRRGYQHAGLRQVCSKFTANATPQTADKAVVRYIPVTISQITPAVRQVADAFLVLQTERHDADYDHSRSFSKEEALTFIRVADACLHAIRHLDKSDASTFGFLLALHAEGKSNKS